MPTLKSWVPHIIMVFIVPRQVLELGDPSRRSCDACESFGARFKKLIKERTCRRTIKHDKCVENGIQVQRQDLEHLVPQGLHRASICSPQRERAPLARSREREAFTARRLPSHHRWPGQGTVAEVARGDRRADVSTEAAQHDRVLGAPSGEGARLNWDHWMKESRQVVVYVTDICHSRVPRSYSHRASFLLLFCVCA